MENKKVFVADYNCVTPLGFDITTTMEALEINKSGIQCYKNEATQSDFYLAKIDDTTIDLEFDKITTRTDFSKLEKLFILALKPLVDNHKVTPKTGLLLSTTKGNIEQLAIPKNPISRALLSNLSRKIADYFGFLTEPIVVSNACVSGLLAISVAKRMLQTEMYDDFYIVAGDIVSDFVLSGFNSFQALSDEPCRPYDEARKGVTLGESAAAAYISTQINSNAKSNIAVIGDGAINDANHISGPSRTGEGLYQSIESAFKEAGISKQKLNYISAHGTATAYNDEMESIAFSRSAINKVPLNSLKGYFGHTLGASGLLEAIIAIECAKRNILLASKGYKNKGVSKDIQVITKNKNQPIHYFLKTASGFGGCNTAVLFEKITTN